MERDILTRSRRKELGVGQLPDSDEDLNPSQNRDRSSLQRQILETHGKAAASGNDTDEEVICAGRIETPRRTEDRRTHEQMDIYNQPHSGLQDTVEGMRTEIGTLIGSIKDLLRPSQQEIVRSKEWTRSPREEGMISQQPSSNRNQGMGPHQSRTRTRQTYDYNEERDQEEMNQRRNFGLRNRGDRYRRLPGQEQVDYEEDRASGHSESSYGHTGQAYRGGSSKLPPFTGKEKWKVWINRFTEVARLRRWNENKKLDEMLPRLQGQAGEFVYGQLTHDIRTNFEALIRELNSRFRVVETCKTFGAQFSNRTQKPGEAVEEYAAELKRLYDNAHATRDQETRKEDLLRKVLDGLADDRTRFHVEYVKEPTDIDEAVYEVVNFQETRRKPFVRGEGHDGRYRKAARTVKYYGTKGMDIEDSETSDEDASGEETTDRIAKAAIRVNKNKPIKKDTAKDGDSKQSTKATEDRSSGENKASNTAKEIGSCVEIKNIVDLLQQMNERLAKLEMLPGPQKPTFQKGNNPVTKGRTAG